MVNTTTLLPQGGIGWARCSYFIARAYETCQYTASAWHRVKSMGKPIQGKYFGHMRAASTF